MSWAYALCTGSMPLTVLEEAGSLMVDLAGIMFWLTCDDTMQLCLVARL